MKDYHINIFYSEEDGGYIADIPDLVSCSAFGETAQEACDLIRKEALEAGAHVQSLDDALEAMVAKGFMERQNTINEGQDRYYKVTPAWCDELGITVQA